MTGFRLGRRELERLLDDADALAEFDQRLQEIAEEAAAVAGLPDAGALLDFLEVPTGTAFDVKPEHALAFFKAKGLKQTFSYADLTGDQHAFAFTVAKMANMDMLAQLRNSLDMAMENGTPFKEWADGIIPILQSGGWWGRKEVKDPVSGATVVAQLGSPWRLETIFRTNMQSAYAAGAWAAIDEQKALAPYLMYDAVDDMRTRPLHASWDGKVLPVKSHWWSSHFPPNGYNCRCGVIQLAADEVEAMGLKVLEDPPDDGTYSWTNPRTGDVEQVPRGLDPGFDTNSGKMWKLQMQDLLAEKVEALPPSMQAAMAKAKAAEDAAAAAAAAKKAAEEAATAKAKQLAAEVAAAQQEAAKQQGLAALERAKAQAIEASKQSLASQQLDLIAKVKPTPTAEGFKASALKQLAAADPAKWKQMTPAERLEAVLERAQQLKLAADLAKGVALYKKQVLAGKTPTASAAKAFKGLAPDDQAKLLDEIAKAKAAAQAAAEAAAKAEAAAQQAAAAASKPAAEPSPIVRGTPPNPAKLTQIGPQRGSNPGGLYHDTDTGVQWYVKQPASADIAANEVLAGKLYELAGVEVPELHLITLNGKPSIASRIVDGLKKADASTLAAAPGTAEGFAVDAWLANWDVVGLGLDNLLVRGARAVRVDTGGALRYRAQGSLKGSAFGDVVTELDSLRDASLNRQSAQVFGRLTAKQVEDSVVTVLRIRDGDIERLVEEFGPRDAIERGKLAERLLARKADLARRFPAAAARARELDGAAATPPKAPPRVTDAEQRFVEESRVNGYGFATDSDQIEDNMVLVHTFRRAKGGEATRGFFKLLAGPSKELQRAIAAVAGDASANAVELSSVREAILAAVKSINFRADKGQALDDTVAGKIATALARIDAAGKELVAAALKAKDKRPIAKATADLLEWRATLATVADDAKARRMAVKLPKVFDTKAFPDLLPYDLLVAPTQGPAPAVKWRKVVGRVEFAPSRFDRSFATETDGKTVLHGVDLRYEAELADGTVITYFPHDSKVDFAMQGVVKIDAPGRGAASSGRIFSAMDEIGLKSARATEIDRQLLYLNAFARLKLLRSSFKAEFDAITETGAEGVKRRLALLKRATGIDIETTEGWKTVDGVRQAFGHGRAYQHRPDLTEADLRKLDREVVLYHNPQGLSTDAGTGVFERVKNVIEGGGIFSSLTDRYRRGVPLSGSSVSSDLKTGGGDYHFTRIRKRPASGSGLFWRSTALRRMDAITYNSDQFGKTHSDHLEQNRQGQSVESLRSMASFGSNETIFKGGLSIFDDLDTIVLANDAEVRDAIAWMQAKGYRTWPDGRALDEVIVAKNAKGRK